MCLTDIGEWRRLKIPLPASHPPHELPPLFLRCFYDSPSSSFASQKKPRKFFFVPFFDRPLLARPLFILLSLLLSVAFVLALKLPYLRVTAVADPPPSSASDKLIVATRRSGASTPTPLATLLHDRALEIWPVCHSLYGLPSRLSAPPFTGA